MCITLYSNLDSSFLGDIVRSGDCTILLSNFAVSKQKKTGNPSIKVVVSKQM